MRKTDQSTHHINHQTRRGFLRTGAQTAGLMAGVALYPRQLIAKAGTIPKSEFSIQDTKFKELIQRGLDAARQEGATYADVRLSHTREMGFFNGEITKENERLHAGVRTLIDGCWSFAASPLWHPEEIVRIARESAKQARMSARFQSRTVELTHEEGPRQGHWETPVKVDAFKVHPVEIRNFMLGVNLQIQDVVARLEPFGQRGNLEIKHHCMIWTQERAFGSSEGHYYTQRLHRTGGKLSVDNKRGIMGDDDELLTLSGAGWEVFADAPIVETVQRVILERLEMAKLPVKPLDVGRYDTVFDAISMAHLVSGTIGAAVELDRALGYEANAGGTSFLNDPIAMLQTYTLGSPHVTVKANRSDPGGLATTQWDDEGVTPQTITLVEQGKLTNFLTSREGVAWLGKGGTHAKRSGGYMYGDTAFNTPLIHTGNIGLQGGTTALSQRDLEAGVSRGMAVVGMNPDIDFGLSGGAGRGFECYELRKGKRIARIANAGILFRTPDFWKSLLAVGGDAHSRHIGVATRKGEPTQSGFHTTTAVPAMVKEVTMVNPVNR